MRRSILAAFVVSLLLPSVLLAHGGGLNQDGCHRETATGGYHCHREEEDDDVNWGVMAGVAGGLLALWIIVEWAKSYTNLAQPVQIVPTFTNEGEAGITADYLFGNGQRIGIMTSSQITDSQDDESIVGLRWKIEF
ncbi:MAG: YHYH domain-containing protein [Alphaproteobacteria bacterium]|nr:YHYH domain-containing protein [Alphaproteobacteria bacterium]